MNDRDRRAYVELLELIEDAGYTIVDEEFSTDRVDPEFNADLWLVAPSETEDD